MAAAQTYPANVGARVDDDDTAVWDRIQYLDYRGPGTSFCTGSSDIVSIGARVEHAALGVPACGTAVSRKPRIRASNRAAGVALGGRVIKAHSAWSASSRAQPSVVDVAGSTRPKHRGEIDVYRRPEVVV